MSAEPVTHTPAKITRRQALERIAMAGAGVAAIAGTGVLQSCDLFYDSYHSYYYYYDDYSGYYSDYYNYDDYYNYYYYYYYYYYMK